MTVGYKKFHITFSILTPQRLHQVEHEWERAIDQYRDIGRKGCCCGFKAGLQRDADRDYYYQKHELIMAPRDT